MSWFCASSTTEENNRLDDSIDLSQWMTSLPASVRALPLHRVAIPGSHNSFTYSLSKSSEVGPDEEQWLQDLARRMGFLAKPIIYNWSVCQSLTCLEQLMIGVRYFDFRLGKEILRKKARRERYRLQRAEIHLLHGLFGIQLEEALTDVQRFLAEHPGEVVLLDFQHVYGLQEQDKRYVTDLIKTMFTSKLCPVTTDVSLDYMSANKYQVIAINKICTTETSPFFWPRSACPNPWANTVSVDELSSFLDKGLRSRDLNWFFVSQAILTPSNSTVFLHLFSTLENCLANKCNKSLATKWFVKVEEEKLPANIIMMDFVSQDITQTIVNFNIKTERKTL